MKNNWFEDTSFWETLYPYIFDINRNAKTAAEVSGIIELLALDKNESIIDFGCGPGRHLIEFAKRGYSNSLGIDLVDYYIKIAKEKAQKETLKLRFQTENIQIWQPPIKYNVALSLFSSFGYYPEHQENMKVLQNIYHALAQNGRFLIDVRSKENFAFNFDEQSWKRINGGIILTKRTALEDFSKIRSDWTIIKHGKEQTFTFTHWIYSAYELKTLLLNTGFQTVQTYGSFSGAPFIPASSRLIMIATK